MYQVICEMEKRKYAIRNHVLAWLNCDITREDLIYILSFRYGYTMKNISELIDALK